MHLHSTVLRVRLMPLGLAAAGPSRRLRRELCEVIQLKSYFGLPPRENMSGPLRRVRFRNP